MQSVRKITKFAQILDFAFIKIDPVFFNIPICIVSFAAYFTTDLGMNALELPFPTMW